MIRILKRPSKSLDEALSDAQEARDEREQEAQGPWKARCQCGRWFRQYYRSEKLCPSCQRWTL